jgi:2-keto-4-pentenoate hydratase
MVNRCDINLTMTTSPDSATGAALRGQLDDRDTLLDEGARRLGWKAGFGTRAAIEKLGTDGPLVGFLTDATLEPSGTTIEVGDWGKAVLEPEVSLRLGADVAAGDGPEAIAAAVEAIGAAIELVDLGEVGGDPAAILATNVYHRKVLLGDFVALPGTLAEVRIDVEQSGEPPVLGSDPAAVLGPLVEVVAGLAAILDGSGDGLRAGDVIITGAAIKPFEPTTGETFEVGVAGSRVAVEIA